MSNIASPFFQRFLTFRQILTHRTTRRLAAVGVVTAGLVIPAGYFLVASGLVASGNGSSTEPASTADPAFATEARLLTVATRELSAAGPEYLQQAYTGIVAARRSSRLASKQVARVESVLVDIGDQVEAGQLLIQLDVQQLTAERQVAAANSATAKARLNELSRGPRQQDIEQAVAQVVELQANVQLSRANFARVTDLRRSSAISKQEYDESRFALEAMVAKLESASQNLELLREGTRVEQIEAQAAVVAAMEAELLRIDADIADRSIHAPFGGSIQSRMIDEGSIVSPGEPLLAIMERAPYEVRVGVPPEVARNLSGSELTVMSGKQELDATISRIAPAINELTRTREIVLQLSETSSHLVSIGSSVKVAVQVPVITDGYWVPSACLTAGPRGLWAVYVTSDPTDHAHQDLGSAKTGLGDGVRKIERRQVELLRAQGQWSEIKGPLAPTDRLVIEGVHRATPGQLVQIVEAGTPELAKHRGQPPTP